MTSYPTKVMIESKHGKYVYAQVRQSLNGQLSLYIGDKTAREVLWNLTAPEPFGRFMSFHGEPGMLAIAGPVTFDEMCAALKNIAARSAKWRKPE